MSTSQQVGISPDYIKDYALELLIETGTSSLVKTKDRSTTLIRIERDVAFAQHRTYRTKFIDVQSERKLFDLWKEAGMEQYYAEHPVGSNNRLLTIDIKTPRMGGPTLRVDFENAVNSGRKTSLEYKIHKFKKIGKVMWEGKEIAEIEEMALGTAIRFAPGVDPLPIIAMVMALHDRDARRSSVTWGPSATGTGDGLTGGTARVGGII